MVNIIEEKPDKSIFKDIICISCGIKLEYLPIDIKKYSGTDYSGGPDGREWIECPKCKNEITLRSW